MAAAVALGIGRAAIAHAIASMKKTGVKPGPDETAPHWAFADGATDVAAARVLTYSAAQMLDRNEAADDVVARAHAFAAKAAQIAVDAAIRVEGAAGYSKGGLLERLSRDARTLTSDSPIARRVARVTARDAVAPELPDPGLRGSRRTQRRCRNPLRTRETASPSPHCAASR